MRTIIMILLAALLIPFSSISQNSASGESVLLSGDYHFLNTSPKFGIQFSSGYTTGSFGGFFTNTVNPQLAFQPTKRLILEVGSVISSSGMPGNSLQSISPASSTQFYSTSFYALGAYQLNTRLTILGAAWTERNNLNSMFMGAQMNPQAFNLNNQGVMMGLEYRIMDNISIGAQMRFSNGGSPFNPYYNNYNQPFYSPFGTNRAW